MVLFFPWVLIFIYFFLNFVGFYPAPFPTELIMGSEIPWFSGGNNSITLLLDSSLISPTLNYSGCLGEHESFLLEALLFYPSKATLVLSLFPFKRMLPFRSYTRSGFNVCYFKVIPRDLYLGCAGDGFSEPSVHTTSYPYSSLLVFMLRNSYLNGWLLFKVWSSR